APSRNPGSSGDAAGTRSRGGDAERERGERVRAVRRRGGGRVGPGGGGARLPLVRADALPRPPARPFALTPAPPARPEDSGRIAGERRMSREGPEKSEFLRNSRGSVVGQRAMSCPPSAV